MSFELEAMIRFLSGQEVDPRLLDELSDPSSEASRFLAATRIRSSQLVHKSASRFEPIQRSQLARQAIGVGLAILILMVCFIGFLEFRIRHLESTLALRDADARALAQRLDVAVSRWTQLPSPQSLEPIETTLNQVANQLDHLTRRVEAFNPTDLKASDATIHALGDGLASLRREVSILEKSQTRSLDELRASNQEVARLVRLLINRTDPEPAASLPPNPKSAGTPRRIP